MIAIEEGSESAFMINRCFHFIQIPDPTKNLFLTEFSFDFFPIFQKTVKKIRFGFFVVRLCFPNKLYWSKNLG